MKRERVHPCPKCGSVKTALDGRVRICREEDCGHRGPATSFTWNRQPLPWPQTEVLSGGRAYKPPADSEGAVPPPPRYPKGNRTQPLKLKP